MARENKLGNSFLGLGLEDKEEKQLKKHLADTDKTGKQYLRKLVREHLKTLK
jgi:hypothetical protein